MNTTNRPSLWSVEAPASECSQSTTWAFPTPLKPNSKSWSKFGKLCLQVLHVLLQFSWSWSSSINSGKQWVQTTVWALTFAISSPQLACCPCIITNIFLKLGNHVRNQQMDVGKRRVLTPLWTILHNCFNVGCQLIQTNRVLLLCKCLGSCDN